MKLFLVFLLSVVGLPAPAQTDSAATPKPTIYSVVEQPPQFPGGMNKLGKYFRQNTRYPDAARQAGIRGRTFVNFVVTDTGAIRDVKLLKSLSPELDVEAVRLIENMPNWIPARQGGKPVNVYYNLPVNFPPDNR